MVLTGDGPEATLTLDDRNKQAFQRDAYDLRVNRAASIRQMLPGSRAVLGGLLMTVAAAGTLATWQRATRPSGTTYVVAARTVEPGQVIEAADLGSRSMELPEAVSANAYTDEASIAGRVAVGPLDPGDLVQAADVSDGSTERLAEVSVRLPRERAVDGRIGRGDWVDVVATVDGGTSVVVEDVRVVSMSRGDATPGRSGSAIVTFGHPDAGRLGEIVHAVDSGEVTLLKATSLPRDRHGSGRDVHPTTTSPGTADEERGGEDGGGR